MALSMRRVFAAPLQTNPSCGKLEDTLTWPLLAVVVSGMSIVTSFAYVRHFLLRLAMGAFRYVKSVLD